MADDNTIDNELMGLEDLTGSEEVENLEDLNVDINTSKQQTDKQTKPLKQNDRTHEPYNKKNGSEDSQPAVNKHEQKPELKPSPKEPITKASPTPPATGITNDSNHAHKIKYPKGFRSTDFETATALKVIVESLGISAKIYPVSTTYRDENNYRISREVDVNEHIKEKVIKFKLRILIDGINVNETKYITLVDTNTNEQHFTNIFDLIHALEKIALT